MKKLLLKLSAAAVAGMIFAGCTPSSPTPTPVPTQSPTQTVTETSLPGVTSSPIVIALATQNSSGQAGTATIQQVGDQVKVILNLMGGSFTAPQPAHFHTGTCAAPGPVTHPLTNVVNGKSETMIDASWDEIMADSTLINIHKSAEEAKVYTACGAIK